MLHTAVLIGKSNKVIIEHSSPVSWASSLINEFSLRRLYFNLFYSITTFADDKEARSEIMNFMGSRNLVFQLKPQQCDLSCVQCTVVFKTHANSMLQLLRITGWEKSDTNHVVTVIRG